MPEDYRDITEMLRAAKHDFHFEYLTAIGRATAYLDLDDIHPEDQEALEDADEQRRWDGQSMTSSVINLIEPIVMKYINLLETVVGLDPNDVVATVDQDLLQ